MGVTRTIYGTVEMTIPGSPKPWRARYENGHVGGHYAQQGEARFDVQAHAGMGAPLTWTLDSAPGDPERYRGEHVVIT